MIRAIIIDDEKKLAKFLQQVIIDLDPDIEVVEIFTEAEKALDRIDELKPEIIFLDIDMPKMSGFDFLVKVARPDFEIIFVTGHNDYAIQAFKFSASGFVLKPVDVDDLKEAITTAKLRLKEKISLEKNRILIENLADNKKKHRKIGIPTMDGLEFTEVDKIVRCEALQRITRVIIEGEQSVISSYNIGEFVKLLSGHSFFSIHKSHLINLNKIKKYYKDGTITMDDGSTVPLARRRKNDFLEVISKIN